MLVLTREADQFLTIDGKIKIHVKQVRGKRVTLAIDVPEGMHVLRGELKAFPTKQ